MAEFRRVLAMNFPIFEPAESAAVIGLVGAALAFYTLTAQLTIKSAKPEDRQRAALIFRYLALLIAGAFFRRDMAFYGIGPAYAIAVVVITAYVVWKYFLRTDIGPETLALVTIAAACGSFYANVSFPLVLIASFSIWAIYCVYRLRAQRRETSSSIASKGADGGEN